MDAALHVVAVVVDVLGPHLTPDVDDHSVDRVLKARHDERLAVVLLVHVGEVDGRKALRGEEGDIPDVLPVHGRLRGRMKFHINE